MVPLNSLSYDMLLQRAIPQDEISFIVLGDSHLISLGRDPNNNNRHILDKNGTLYKKILKEIVDLTLNGSIHPLFILHGGDAVDAGHAENFDAFVKVSTGVLNKANIPIFVSVGNHDYNLEDFSTDFFKHYIGEVRGSFQIPLTDIKVIRLNTHYSGPHHKREYYGFFDKKDIEELPKDSRKYHYLIDFHTPLRVCNSHNTTDNFHFLSDEQTHNFLSNINPNVCGIFCHHKHIYYSCSINYKYKGQPHPLPFIISGCAGNHTNHSTPHYYYVTLNRKNYNLTYNLHPVS